MARKPVKKRKQSRVSVKRKTKSAKAKPVSVKQPKPFKPTFNLKIGIPEDPFFIHPETIPDGVALQWVTSSVMGTPQGDLPYAAYSFVEEAIKGGWKLVEGQKPLGGLVLMWAAQEVAKAQTQDNIDRAKQQMADARALFGMDGSKASPYHGSRFPMVQDTFMVSSAYASVPAGSPSIDVDITIKFRVSARWQDAAAALGLDVQEYARRRLIMDATILAPYGSRFDDDMAYSPVELQITRKDN